MGQGGVLSKIPKVSTAQDGARPRPLATALILFGRPVIHGSKTALDQCDVRLRAASCETSTSRPLLLSYDPSPVGKKIL